jgi:hypothetical protein
VKRPLKLDLEQIQKLVLIHGVLKDSDWSKMRIDIEDVLRDQGLIILEDTGLLPD